MSTSGVAVKRYPNNLVVLNYDQIESPKANPIMMECRELLGLDIDQIERQLSLPGWIRWGRNALARVGFIR